MKYSDLEIGRVLGMGSSRVAVYLVRNKSTKEILALKVMKDKNKYTNELVIFIKLSHTIHPNVLRFVANFEQDDKYMILMEYVKYSMHNLITSNKHKDYDRLKLVYTLAKGVKFLHDNDIVHCDIKTENVMCRDNSESVIIDFDLSRIIQNGEYLHTKGFVGTPEYYTPEMVMRKELSKATDCWCIGLIAYELYYKLSPFDGGDIEGTSENILNYNYKLEGKEIDDLIKKLLVSKRTRISIDEILSHPIFSGY
jgi:serine/threonine protein kinase